MAADGTLRAVKNVIPLGPAESFVWSSAEAALQRGTLINILGIVAHARQRLGPLSDLVGDPNQSFERLVALTDADLRIVDPGQSFVNKVVRTLPSVSTARKMQGAQVGESLFLAVSGPPPAVGVPYADRGFPEPVLEVRDDSVIDFQPPPLPLVAITVGKTAVAGETVEPKLTPGRYGIRYSYALQDGSYGPPSAPLVVTVGVAVTTLSVAIVAGNTSFTVVNGFALAAAIVAARQVNDDIEYWSTLYVEDEIVRYVTIDPVTGVVTLASGYQFGQAHAVGAGVQANEPWWIKFQTTVGVNPSAAFQQIADGLQVSISTRLAETEDAYRTPYYRVLKLKGWGMLGTIGHWSDFTDLISSYPLLDETLLSVHEVGAASIFSYNGRLHLGDLAFDYLLPDFRVQNAAGASKVRVGVKIRTEGGAFYRIGPELLLDSLTVAFKDNSIVYPDARVEEFYVFVDAGAGYKTAATYAAKQSEILNLSYYLLDAPVTYAAGASDMPDATSVNAAVERLPNRFVVSDTLRPRSIRAENVIEVGNSRDDAVMGFAVNSLPVSEGQYGLYPLVILGAETVSLAQTGDGEVPYLSIQRVANRGCVGRYAFTQVEQRVYFASRDGIWSLEPAISNDPTSDPIHYHHNARDLFECLTNDTALGYYNDTSRGRRELWVAAGELVFGYSEKHGTWFILDRVRRAFLAYKGILYGAGKLDDNALMYDEGAGDELVEIYIRTNRLTLGSPGTRKRLYRTSIRQNVQAYEMYFRFQETLADGTLLNVASGVIAAGAIDTVSHAGATIVAPYLELWAHMRPGQSIVAALSEFEVRSERRPVGILPASANVTLDALEITNLPWNCSEGFDVAIVPEPPPPPPDFETWDKFYFIGTSETKLRDRTDPATVLNTKTIGFITNFNAPYAIDEKHVNEDSSVTAFFQTTQEGGASPYTYAARRFFWATSLPAVLYESVTGLPGAIMQPGSVEIDRVGKRLWFTRWELDSSDPGSVDVREYSYSGVLLRTLAFEEHSATFRSLVYRGICWDGGNYLYVARLYRDPSPSNVYRATIKRIDLTTGSDLIIAELSNDAAYFTSLTKMVVANGFLVLLGAGATDRVTTLNLTTLVVSTYTNAGFDNSIEGGMFYDAEENWLYTAGANGSGSRNNKMYRHRIDGSEKTLILDVTELFVVYSITNGVHPFQL
jgi:hypothetical protein